MATTEIDLDLTEIDSIVESFFSALAPHSQLRLSFGETENDCTDGFFDPSLPPAEIVEQFKHLKPARLLGTCMADWCLTTDDEDLEAENAEGNLIIHVQGADVFVDRSQVGFKGVALSWRFPSKLGCWMDPIEPFDLTINFKLGRVYVLRWPS